MKISRYNSEGYSDPTPHKALSNIMKGEKKEYMPIIYIASPFSGDVETNTIRAQRYCRFAVSKGYMPIAPHLHYPQFLDDEDADERELGLRFALILLCKCEELWVFDKVSEGMSREIVKAKRRGIPIRYFNSNCEEVSYD